MMSYICGLSRSALLVTECLSIMAVSGFETEAIFKLEEEFQKLKEECIEFSFLAVGKTGAGKSTLLNALTETRTFAVGHDRSTVGTPALSIPPYVFYRNGVKITVWDSPGFQDCLGNEKKYRNDLKDNCSDVDLFLYCISLKEVKADLGQDGSGIQQITRQDALGVEIWKRSVIILTFANKLESRLKTDGKKGGTDLEAAFEEKIGFWKEKIREALQQAGVEDSVIQQIPVLPAGHIKRKHLPGQQYWLSNLWFRMLKAVKDEHAKVALYKANEDRIVPEKDAEKSSPLALVLTEENLSIAAGGVAGVAGAAVGGATGAVIGTLAVGISTFGIGAIVGLTLGLVVGAAIGGGVGAATVDVVKKVREKRRAKKECKEQSVTESDSSSSHTDSLSSADIPSEQAGST